jgi:hypothetical protein
MAKYEMQNIDAFYYPNNIDVQLNVNPALQLRNRVMYQRTVKLYQGIDNLVKFTFKNSDQKRVNVLGWDIYFNITDDEEGSVIVTKQAVVLGDPVQGEVTVTVTESDLMDLEYEYYAYSLSVRDPLTGFEQVVYTDDNYNARGKINVLSGHYPQFRKSVKVQLPTNSNSIITSSTVTADTPTRQQSAHHTAQLYFTGFTGNVLVQTTLDALPPNGNTSANTSVSWATVSTLQFVDQNVSTYTTWDGVYSASRFMIMPNSGSVTKILYRS